MENKIEMSIFTAKLRLTGKSLVVTLPKYIREFEGLKEGDYLRVHIKKLSKEVQE